MLKSSNISPREMCDLYRGNVPTGQIAKRAGITTGGVRYHLKRHKVKMRKKGSLPYTPGKTVRAKNQKRKARRIPINEMKNLYTVQKKSIREVAAAAGVSTFTANRDLTNAGVTLRPRGGAGTKRNPKRSLTVSVAPVHHNLIRDLVQALNTG